MPENMSTQSAGRKMQATPPPHNSRLPRPSPSFSPRAVKENNGRSKIRAAVRRVSFTSLRESEMKKSATATPTALDNESVIISTPPMATRNPQNKPLPSPPVVQTVTPGPVGVNRCLIDAAEQSLRVSPGTPEEKDWPSLTPERDGSLLASNDAVEQSSHGEDSGFSPIRSPSLNEVQSIGLSDSEKTLREAYNSHVGDSEPPSSPTVKERTSISSDDVDLPKLDEAEEPYGFRFENTALPSKRATKGTYPGDKAIRLLGLEDYGDGDVDKLTDAEIKAKNNLRYDARSTGHKSSLMASTITSSQRRVSRKSPRVMHSAVKPIPKNLTPSKRFNRPPTPIAPTMRRKAKAIPSFKVNIIALESSQRLSPSSAATKLSPMSISENSFGSHNRSSPRSPISSSNSEGYTVTDERHFTNGNKVTARIKRLSAACTLPDCGPVLTVYEGADEVILGNEGSSAKRRLTPEEAEEIELASSPSSLSESSVYRKPTRPPRRQTVEVPSDTNFNFGFSDKSTIELASSDSSVPDGFTEWDMDGNAKLAEGKMSRAAYTKFDRSVYPAFTEGLPQQQVLRHVKSEEGHLGNHVYPVRSSSIPTRNASSTILESYTSTEPLPPITIHSQQNKQRYMPNPMSLPTLHQAEGLPSKTGPPVTQKSTFTAKGAMSNIRGLFQKKEDRLRQRIVPNGDAEKPRLTVSSKGSPIPRKVSHPVRSVFRAGQMANKRSSIMRRSIDRSSAMQYDSLKAAEADRGLQSTAGRSEVAKLAAMVEMVIDKARQSVDGNEAAKLLSVAQVMVQAVSTAKTAESSMIAAKQAAKEATMSFQLTQRSVKEMMRLMNQTNSLTRLLRPG